MLTLQELKQMVEVPGDRRKLPTARQLRETSLEIVREQLSLDSEISVYQKGYVLYRVGNHSTVFPLYLCRDYLYLSDGYAAHLSESFFDNEKWYLRLVLEGEDRLNRNHEERERSWNVSYNAASEEWAAIEILKEPVMDRLIRKETVEEILQILTERQKFVIQRYYLQEETQEQISRELGVSQQTVSALISQAIRTVRKKYPFYGSFPVSRICCRKGNF